MWGVMGVGAGGVTPEEEGLAGTALGNQYPVPNSTLSRQLGAYTYTTTEPVCASCRVHARFPFGTPRIPTGMIEGVERVN